MNLESPKEIKFKQDLGELVEKTFPDMPLIERKKLVNRIGQTYSSTLSEIRENPATDPWVSCSCGRVHYRDPVTGAVESGWY